VQLGRIVNLPELPTYTPLIAYLVHHHAVVIWGYTADGKRLLVGDPAAGLVEMRMDELLSVHRVHRVLRGTANKTRKTHAKTFFWNLKSRFCSAKRINH